MITIKQHLELEKANLKPRKFFISDLEKILQRKRLTIKQWRLTGRFTPAEIYYQENPDVELDAKCKEVIEYAGKSFIQVFSSGDFVFKDTFSKNLNKVEEVMWDEVCGTLWE